MVIDYEIELIGGPAHGTIKQFNGDELPDTVSVETPDMTSPVIGTMGCAQVNGCWLFHLYRRDESKMDGPAVFRFERTEIETYATLAEWRRDSFAER